MAAAGGVTMRKHSPYPRPPSKRWALAMLLLYVPLALAGALTLVLVPLVPQSTSGALVLIGWGSLSLLGGVGCTLGVLAERYRPEWVSCWLLAMGQALYLAVTVVQTWDTGVMLQSLPTMLVFVSVIGALLSRAVHLELSDRDALHRKQLQQIETGGLSGE